MKLDFFILILGILTVLILYYFSEKGIKFKIPKRKRNSSKKAKKKFWSEDLKETIRWTIFSLICLILLLVVIKYVFSLFDNGKTNSKTATETSYVTHTSDTTFLETKKVYYGTSFGNKIEPYLDHPYNSEYDFRGATQNYCIKNKYDRIVYAEKGKDAEPEMIKYSNGNLYFKIRSMSGKAGYIFVRIYRVN